MDRGWLNIPSFNLYDSVYGYSNEDVKADFEALKSEKRV